MLTSLPGGVWGFLVFINLFIFFLAFFLDFFEIAFIILPMVAPIAQKVLAPVAAKLGIDLVWFGVMICVNMQTSFMHPPFGFALFYLRGISDTLFRSGSLPRKVESKDIYLGAIPWVLMQLVLVAIVIAFPQSVTAFLDKEKPVDAEAATRMLEGMGLRSKPPLDAASGALPTPAPADEREDPMEAIRRANEQDKQKKP